MPTLWNEARRFERFLQKQLARPARLAFLRKLREQPEFRHKLNQQEQVYRLVRLQGRQQLKQEISSVQKQLWQDPKEGTLQQQLQRIFPRE